MATSESTVFSIALLLFAVIIGGAGVGKASSNRDCSMDKILAEVRADIENQVLRRAAVIALPDFV